MKNPIFLDKNIQRVENFVQKYYSKKRTLKNGYPVFSSIEISLNGACNRRCEFCPRVSKEEYPNLYQSLDFSDFTLVSIFIKIVNKECNIFGISFLSRIISQNPCLCAHSAV